MTGDSRTDLERLLGPMTAGSASALGGAIAASLIASACEEGIESCRCEKAEEELRGLRDRARSLRRDFLASLDLEPAASPIQGDMKELLFAAEVPLRIATGGRALLELANRALGRVGLKVLTEIGVAAELAFAAVVGGTVAARRHLSRIPPASGVGAARARKRAESLMKDAETSRAKIAARVAKHLP